MRHTCTTRGRSAALPLPVAATLVAAMLAVAAATAPVGSATAASSDDYPSWSDVQSAMKSEAAKEAEAARVQAGLQKAQASAEQAAQASFEAAAAADRADADLAAATDRQRALAAQAAAAESSARQAHDALGRLVAWRYRDASAQTVTIRLAFSAHPEQLLDRLGAADRIGQIWATLSDRAVAQGQVAASLRDQASRAEDARRALAVRARDAADAAKAAADVEKAAVAAASAHEKTLLAQLAVLRGTTAEVQKQFEIGQQVKAQEEAQARAREEAAHSGHGSTGYPSTDGVSVDPAGAKAYAKRAIRGYGWGSNQYQCLLSLWTLESGWRANALNRSSGAYGIPQALPGKKMAAAGPDWRTNGNTQVDWGLAYISSRYGTPCGAWRHEMSTDPHWY